MGMGGLDDDVFLRQKILLSMCSRGIVGGGIHYIHKLRVYSITVLPTSIVVEYRYYLLVGRGQL